MADQIQIVDQPSAKQINEVNETLLRFSAIFPFELFPDEVILDRMKISVIKKDFILSKRIITIPLTGTLNVEVSKGPLTSQIVIADTASGLNSVRVKNILYTDALYLQRLVEGIVVGIKQGINFMGMSREELLASASKWGTVDVDTV